MKIWTLDDGIPGHWSMTAGLVGLFRGLREIEETRIHVDWRWGGARQAFQRLERMGIRMPGALLKSAVKFDPTPTGKPDLIISRGGATLYANAWLARECGCPNIFIGTVRKLPARFFSAVILYQDDHHPAPYVAMPLFPTRIDPSSLAGSAAAFPWSREQPTGGTAAMFLGGDGSGYQWQMPDWQRLATGMRLMHESSGVRWCVTSSRRTPAEVEKLLDKELPSSAIAESSWWHAGDRRPSVDAFLGAAEQAFCTEDSMSMLEECIASGRPTVSLGLGTAKPNGFFREYLQQRVNSRRLRRLDVSAFADGVAYPVTCDGGWNPVGPSAMSESAASLLNQLGL